MNRDNGWSLDHPLYRINFGINIHFYFGTFMQKDVAIYTPAESKDERW